MNKNKSVHEVHMELVEELKKRGEKILQPKRNSMNTIYGYIKSENPHVCVGAIFKDQNEKFGLFGDFGAIHITGIEWEDLGLCDARYWHEWTDKRLKEKNNHIKIESLKKSERKIDDIIEELDKIKILLIQTKNDCIELSKEIIVE